MDRISTRIFRTCCTAEVSRLLAFCFNKRPAGVFTSRLIALQISHESTQQT